MAWFDLLPEHYNTDSNGCCVWNGRLNSAGRPVNPAAPTVISLFRYLCYVEHGPPPSSDYHAAHLCNNGLCVNVKHGEWQPSSVNNPVGPNTEKVAVGNHRVLLKLRKNSKGGGREMKGWCAVIQLGGKQHKSGAYTTKEAALRWAKNRLGVG